MTEIDPEHLTIPELMEAVAEERGTTPAELTKGLFAKAKRIRSMVIND